MPEDFDINIIDLVIYEELQKEVVDHHSNLEYAYIEDYSYYPEDDKQDYTIDKIIIEL